MPGEDENNNANVPPKETPDSTPTASTTEHVAGAETTETSEPTPAHEAADAPVTAAPDKTVRLTLTGSLTGSVEVAVGTKYGDALGQLTDAAGSYTFRNGNKAIDTGASLTADTTLTSVKKVRAG